MTADRAAIRQRIVDWLTSTSETYAGSVGGDEWVDGLTSYLVDNPHAPDPASGTTGGMRAAVEALAEEWEALADWVDDPGSTADQRARSRAGVVAAQQLRAVLAAHAEDAAPAGGVDAIAALRERVSDALWTEIAVPCRHIFQNNRDWTDAVEVLCSQAVDAVIDALSGGES